MDKEKLMMTVKARFDGRVFIPHSPVDLPAGCEVEIALTPPTLPASAEGSLAALAELAYLFPDNPDDPPDLAAQHDHYLYGIPKRP
jgi:hypothetical protein